MKAFVESVNQSCGEELKTLVNASGRLGFFLGSGISMHHYPSWFSLPEKLKEKYTLNGWEWDDAWEVDKAKLSYLNPKDLQALFQRICDHNSGRYLESLQAIFDVQPTSHREAIFKIINFNPELIVTLNFDVSIQAAYRVLNRDSDYTLRVFPIDLTLSRERDNAAVLMHLHGKLHTAVLKNPDWLVLHKKGYDLAYHDGPLASS